MASTSQWPHVQEGLDQHNEERTKEVDSLKGQIEIVMADLDVMAGMLKMIGSCEAAAASACRPDRRVHEGSGVMMVQLAEELAHRRCAQLCAGRRSEHA